MDNNKPLVNVCMITYNHENYVSKAIEGVLMQSTSFSYELIIGDDYSTDSTLSICEKYAAQEVKKIKVLKSRENLGIVSNFIRTLKTCSAKYIAICEGDDYWTDPNKLQKQVDFLEKNPEFSICFNKVRLLKEGKLCKDNITRVPKSETNIFDLLKYGNFIHTNSIVFRNTELVQIPQEIVTADYALILFLTRSGEKVKYFKKAMSVYRIHSGGIWSLKNKKQKIKNEIVFYHLMKGTFNNEISNIITSKFLFLISYYFERYCCSKQEKDDFINWCKTRFDPFPFDDNYINALVLFKTKIEEPRYTFSLFKNKILSGIFRDEK